MLIDVDPGAFAAASVSLGRRLAPQLEDVYQSLSIGLGGCDTMAGGDSGGRRWSAEYDRTGPIVATRIADLDTAMRRLAGMLQATGFNHGRADEASDAARRSAPPDLSSYDVSPPSRYGLPGGAGGIVPSAAGGSGDHPGGWGLIEALVGWEWPDGRQDRLRRAGRAWHSAARSLSALTGYVDDAVTAIGFQHSPEVPDALALCRDLRANLQRVAEACDGLSDACARLAQHIDEVHGAVVSALEWLVALSAATQVAGAIVSVVTVGLAEGPTQAVEAGELRLVAGEVDAYIARFVTAAGDVALLVSRVDSEVLAVTRFTDPILAATIRTADVELVVALPNAALDAPLTRLAAAADWDAPLSARLRGYLLDDTGAIGTSSTSARIKQAGLPTRGPIRFVPDAGYRPGAPLYRGKGHGYLDRFGNEWVKGPSRTPGEPYEWDVTLSPAGRASVGWLSRDGKHLNVSLRGWVTH